MRRGIRISQQQFFIMLILAIGIAFGMTQRTKAENEITIPESYNSSDQSEWADVIRYQVLPDMWPNTPSDVASQLLIKILVHFTNGDYYYDNATGQFTKAGIQNSEKKNSSNGKSYTITFNPNGGKFEKSSDKKKKVTNGKKYGTLPKKVKKKGYVLLGWNNKIDGGNIITKDTIVLLGKDTTLYARWGYKVTFDPNGGSVDPKSKNYEKKEKYGKLPDPTRKNYLFNGWYTEKKGGKKVTDKTECKKSCTLYAHWERQKPKNATNKSVWKVRTTINTDGITSTDKFSLSFFKKHNSKLVRLSALAAAATYGGGKNTLLFLEQCGFTGMKGNPAKLSKNFRNPKQIFTGLSTKSTDDDNDNCTIYTGYQLDDNKPVIAIIISGYSSSGKEWISNFNLGSGKTHKGFGEATEKAFRKIRAIYGDSVLNRSTIWITGHSRGGALTNLLAAKIKETYPHSKILAYGFATPNGIDKSLKKNYSGIFNYVNTGDFVPYVAPSAIGWNYTKHGKTIEFKMGNKEKKKFKKLRGNKYTGQTKAERIALITAFCAAGISKELYSNQFFGAIGKRSVSFSPEMYCKEGLARAVNEKDNSLKGILYMLHCAASDETYRFTALTDLLIINGNMINPRIIEAHLMETYLAYIQTNY